MLDMNVYIEWAFLYYMKTLWCSDWNVVHRFLTWYVQSLFSVYNTWQPRAITYMYYICSCVNSLWVDLRTKIYCQTAMLWGEVVQSIASAIISWRTVTTSSVSSIDQSDRLCISINTLKKCFSFINGWDQTVEGFLQCFTTQKERYIRVFKVLWFLFIFNTKNDALFQGETYRKLNYSYNLY